MSGRYFLVDRDAFSGGFFFNIVLTYFRRKGCGGGGKIESLDRL